MNESVKKLKNMNNSIHYISGQKHLKMSYYNKLKKYLCSKLILRKFKLERS